MSSNYKPAPKTPEAFPGLKRVKPKTSVRGGGGLRRRWKDEDGNIYKWDSQHGELEKYSPKGKYLGAFAADTGKQLKPADDSRTVQS